MLHWKLICYRYAKSSVYISQLEHPVLELYLIKDLMQCAVWL